MAKSATVPQGLRHGYKWNVFKYLHFLMSVFFVRFILPNLVGYYHLVFHLHVLCYPGLGPGSPDKPFKLEAAY